MKGVIGTVAGVLDLGLEALTSQPRQWNYIINVITSPNPALKLKQDMTAQWLELSQLPGQIKAQAKDTWTDFKQADNNQKAETAGLFTEKILELFIPGIAEIKAVKAVEEVASVATRIERMEEVVRKEGDIGGETGTVAPPKPSKLPEIEGTGKVGTKLTEPSLPNGGNPKGDYTKGDSHGVKKENETADHLAEQGYDIEMLNEVNGGNGYGIKETSNPDFLIEGEVFDCYAPNIDTNMDNILRNIRTKTKTQAERIVLNLDGFTPEKITEITEGILRKANPNGDLKNLQELLIVVDGKIIRIFGG